MTTTLNHASSKPRNGSPRDSTALGDTTMPTPGQLRLNTLVAGHPLALARLREMQAVVEAAREFTEKFTVSDSYSDEFLKLQKVLVKGGWL